jgi:hypothetical protein
MSLFRKLRPDGQKEVHEPKSVIKEWIYDLDMMQQTVILEMIRGCDGTSKNDPSKQIVRALRNIVLESATTGNFMDVDEDQLMNSIKTFFEDLDHYPLHFVMHLAHSIEIIGYEHPDEKVREFWSSFYFDFCHTIHVAPESKETMEKRLRDGRSPTEHAEKYKLMKEWKEKAAKKKKEEEVAKRKKEAAELAQARAEAKQKMWDSGRDLS